MPGLLVPVPVVQWAQALAVWQWVRAIVRLKPQQVSQGLLLRAQRQVDRGQAAQQEQLLVRPVLRHHPLKTQLPMRRRVLPARLTAVLLL